MKNSGLRNRFSQDTKSKWLGWNSCIVCMLEGRPASGADALHHIVSPSSMEYIDGEHNESILNSCPIHNQRCHIGNEAYLYKKENIARILKMVKRVLELYQDIDISQQQNDRDFEKLYRQLYSLPETS